MFSREEPGGCSYFLANRRCFFHRFADDGFRNKWTGFWARETKLVEFFAVKVGGEWLSGANQTGFEYDFSSATHTYATASGRVRETVIVPEGRGFFAVEIECEADAEIELKLAMNIRRIDENETGRRYSVREGEGIIAFSNELLTAFFSARDARFFRHDRYETHEPSGERQSYFLPGRIVFSGRRASFAVGVDAADPSAFGALLSSRRAADASAAAGLISSDCGMLSEAFEASVLALGLLRRDNGFCAGLPWFQQLWGRDSMWALPALADLGRFAEARAILEYFAFNSDGRQVPNFISGHSGKAFNSIDATLLWLIALEHYVKASGDTCFLNDAEVYIRGYLDFLFSREKGGYLEHDADSSETWMDTQRRSGKAAEIQALYYRALKSCLFFFSVLKGEALRKDLVSKMAFLEKSFDRDFFRRRFYADRIGPDGPVIRRTANALLPVLYGPGRKAADILGAARTDRFLCAKGIRTLSSDEKGYDPKGYHNGSAWSLTTAWAAAAEFRHGSAAAGWRLMKMMMEDIQADALGCIGECWDSGTSSLIGCPLQLWGSAFLIRLVDEYMLGIEPDAARCAIRVSPRLPPDVRRIERAVMLGQRKVTLSFSRRGGRVLSSCSDPGVKLIKA